MNIFSKKLTAFIATFAITAMCLPCMPNITAEAATTSTFTGENLLADYDPDFEGSTLSSKWSAKTGSTTEISKEQKKSGDQSLKITVSSAQQVGPTAASITLEAGKTYLFSAYIYPLKADKYRLRVTGSTPWRTCTVNTWNHLAEVVSVSQDTNVSLYFQNATGATYSGTVYVDNIEVYEIEFGNNLLSDRDPDFETIDVSTYTTDSNSPLWNVRSITSVGNTTEQKKSGSKSVKVDRDGKGQQVGLMAENVSFSAGKRYYASAWVYSDKTAKYRLRVQADGFTDANEQVWISANANTWTQIHAVTNCTKASTGYFYIQAENATNSDIVYIDNFELYDITPPAPEATIVKSPLNGAQKVSVNTDLKLVFSQEVKEVTASNIEINGATVGTITPSADNKTFTVDLGTLTASTSYSAKVTGVVDTNGNTVADTIFTFTTAHADYENLLADHDPGFELKTADDVLENKGFDDKKWISRGTAVVDGTVAHAGANSVKITAMSGPRAVLTSDVIEEGNLYYASVWVKTEAEDLALNIGFGGTDGWSKATALTKDQWTKVEGVFKAKAAGDAAVSATYSDITNGYALYLNKAEGTFATTWVDDFEIYEVDSYYEKSFSKDSVANTISCTFKNHKNSNNLMLAVAAYDASGKLVYIDSSVSTTTSGTLTVNAPTGTYADVKVFLWDVKTFAPIVEAFSPDSI